MSENRDLVVPKGTILMVGKTGQKINHDTTLSTILDTVKSVYKDFLYGGYKFEDGFLKLLPYSEVGDFNGSAWFRGKKDGINQWDRYRITNPSLLKELNPQKGAILSVKGLDDFIIAGVTNAKGYITIDIQSTDES